MTELRDLPSVDKLLTTRLAADLIASFGRPLTLQAIRSTLDKIREDYKSGNSQVIPDSEAILNFARNRLHDWVQPSLLPVINATGVILHTNLGRSPLSSAAMQAMNDVARGYSNLEYGLDKGVRGSRLEHAESILRQLTGAQAAIVVNNNAAAVLLALTALARRRKVVIARSQLVEIGGGFRIPDVMKQSGAKLVEVGTTNRVNISDYEQAFEVPVALVMRAHRSNFQIIGFTAEPELKEIVEVSHKAGIPVLDDLGSGSLLETSAYGLGHEPTVQESLAAGADLVCFSGDKLLGGPQAGIIIGRKDLIDKIKKHPLARAVRADKLCLAALAATLLHYLKDEAERKIPVWLMISATKKGIRDTARRWVKEIGQGEVIPGESTVGGGSLPGENLPTFLIALTVRSPDAFLARLRGQNPPVIARAQDDRVLIDPRTVLPEQSEALLIGIKKALYLLLAS